MIRQTSSKQTTQNFQRPRQVPNSVQTSANKNKYECFSSSHEDQILSPAPNRAKLLSENKGVLSDRTQTYKSPRLVALDGKLKSMMHEKKHRLMNKMKSPLKQNDQNLVRNNRLIDFSSTQPVILAMFLKTVIFTYLIYLMKINFWNENWKKCKGSYMRWVMINLRIYKLSIWKESLSWKNKQSAFKVHIFISSILMMF